MLVQLGGIVTYTAVDGARKKKTTTLAAAQKFAHEMIGAHPTIGSNYAVSDDGVGKITCSGCTLEELFPAPVETAPAPVVEAAPVQNKTKKTDKPVKAPSAVNRIRELMIENPKLPLKAVVDQLTLEGFKFSASTPGTIRVDFLASWRLLQQHGKATGLDGSNRS